MTRPSLKKQIVNLRRNLPPGILPLPTDSQKIVEKTISTMDNNEIWERLRKLICSKSPSLGHALPTGHCAYNPPDQIIIDVTQQARAPPC
jgi:hypothetical protein